MTETRRIQVVYSVDGNRKANYVEVEVQSLFTRHKINQLLTEAVKRDFGNSAKFHHIKYGDRSF